MSEERFSVCQFFAYPPGRYEYVARDVGPNVAISIAGSICQSVSVQLGRITEIMITDRDDYCVWLWERGRGVVYPVENMRSESDVERRRSSS